MLSFQQLALATENAKSDIKLPGFSQVLKYLRDRGIETADIDRLHLFVLPASQLVSMVRNGAQSHDDRIAVVFPHYDHSGNPIEWWSARLVESGLQIAYTGFNQYIDRTQRGKMFCPPSEPPHGYLPPIIDWTKLQRGQKIFIQESCIKAVAGAKLGAHSVGLNGVWGWTSRKHDIRLISEIRSIPWKQLELKPVIVFDSNAEDNWDVQNAIAKLSQAIHSITGQKSYHILLPKKPDGTHWGFDDFVAHHGSDIATEFLQSEGREIPISGVEVLKLQLNSEVCVVRSLGRIAEQTTGTLMTKSTFTDVNYAHYTSLSEDEDPKSINVPRMWLSDSRRSEVESLAYLPGQSKISNGVLNLWRGMGQEPLPGDVEPFLYLLKNNIQDEEIRHWILQWFAFPLQNLGTKLNTFLHLFGPAGTGKNMLLRPILRIYGSNGITIGREHIASNFTSIYATKQFVNIDEVHGAREIDGMAVYNKIKKMVTGEELIVNTKGQPEYSIKNCINLVTTSNYYDSLKLDADDRRAVVVRFDPTQDHRNDQGYWISYADWCDGDGASAIYDYLLRLDLRGFDPKGWAPNTEYKEEVIDAARSPMERWSRDLFANADNVLPPISVGRSLFSPSELAVLYYGKGRDELRKGQVDALGLQLRNVGFKKANGGTPLKVAGILDRYWVIRDKDKDWSSSDPCQQHLKQFFKK